MAKWFCKLAGSEVGPLSPGQLLQFVREGKIVADTPIRKDDSQWVPAEALNGLFATAGKQTKQIRCPYCTTILTELPATCHSCHRQVESTYMLRDDKPTDGKPKSAAVRGHTDASWWQRFTRMIEMR